MGLTFIYPTLPSCIRPEVRLLINVFCVVMVFKKRKLLCLAQVVFYFVLHSNKIPLVLTTKVTHLCSQLFRQPDRVNYVVRRLFCWVYQNRLVQSVV